MTKINKILVPDILPNNLKIIREIRGFQLKDIANALDINRNFLSAVEAGNKNFSGKTTIKALKHYGLSFYKMYDVKEKVALDTTDYFDNTFNTTLSFDPMDILDVDLSKYDDDYIQNIINNFITKEIDDLKTNNLIIKEINTISKSNKVKGSYDSFDIIGSTFIDNKLYLDLEVVYKEERTQKIEYDINFVKNEDIKLADMLSYKGYLEGVKTVDKEIDGENVRIDGNRVYLGNTYKLLVDGEGNNFVEKDYMKLSDRNLTLKYDELTNEPKTIKFKVLKPDMNNLKAIRTLTNISIAEMYKGLGLSYNGYINLELGNQKISTKVMWRLVQKLKLPLELILNIDEYYEKYCNESPIIKEDNYKEDDN